MSAPLTSAGATQQMPATQQTLQPTSLDQSRNVERSEPTPHENQIQSALEPSAQSQASNHTEDNATGLGTGEIVKLILEIKEMQNSGDLPDLGAVLDQYA